MKTVTLWLEGVWRTCCAYCREPVNDCDCPDLQSTRCAWCGEPLDECGCLMSDVPPSGFDPAYAGERWADDY
jgi:hypothetical protein